MEGAEVLLVLFVAGAALGGASVPAPTAHRDPFPSGLAIDGQPRRILGTDILKTGIDVMGCDDPSMGWRAS